MVYMGVSAVAHMASTACPSSKIIPVEEVKSRWAYSEINSSRWGDFYRTHAPRKLVHLAAEGVRFDQLPQTLTAPLPDLIQRARGEAFVSHLDQSDHYHLQAISAPQLCEIFTLGVFADAGDLAPSLPLRDFFARPLDQSRSWSDPRSVAANIDEQIDLVRSEAGIVINYAGRPTLFDGYLRAAHFLRRKAVLYSVWIPATVQAKHY